MIRAKRRKRKPLKIHLQKKEVYYSGHGADNSPQDLFCGECKDKVCFGNFTKSCPDAKIDTGTYPGNEYKLYRIVKVK